MKTLRFLLALTLASTAAAIAAETEHAAFRVEVTGRGRPMLLIPGLASPGAVWDSTVAHFRDGYECHVVSLAGFGGIPARPASGPLLAGVRDELAAYIRRTALDRPIIIGHSLGGFLALDLAATHPDLAGPLVIVDSLPFLIGVMQPDATPETAKQFAAGTARAYAQMDPDAYARMIRGGPNGSTMAANPTDVDRIVSWGLASDPKTVVTAMTELYTRDLRPALPAIAAPALALAAWAGYAPYASHDSIAAVYRDQYAGLKNVRIAITDTARHFIMLDEPEWMFDQIESFLAAHAVAR